MQSQKSLILELHATIGRISAIATADHSETLAELLESAKASERWIRRTASDAPVIPNIGVEQRLFNLVTAKPDPLRRIQRELAQQPRSRPYSGRTVLRFNRLPKI